MKRKLLACMALVLCLALLCGCTAEEAEKRLTEKDGYIARVVG